MTTIIIFGATSAIAHAIAREYISESANYILVGRNADKLASNAKDLLARGASNVETYRIDFSDFTQTNLALDTILLNAENIDIAIIAQSILPADSIDPLTIAETTYSINVLSCIACMEKVATKMALEASGTIAVISSIAGERGRQSNYLYVSTKAAITSYASGLRNRFLKKGVHVITIKPGFVDTPMIKNMQPNLLWRTPKQIAPQIKNAIQKKRNSIFVPSFWRLIMFIIKNIPEPIFKRLSL